MVIFDLDGTLLDSMDGILRAVNHVFDSVGKEHPTYNDYILNFRFPFGAFYRDRGVTLSDSEILSVYREGLGEGFDPDFHLDALHVVTHLQNLSFTSAIVTANSLRNASKALDKAGFGSGMKIISAPNKVEAIRKLVKQSSLGSRTPYVGDSCADMMEAREAGAKPVAVLRGDLINLAPHFHKAGAQACVSSLVHLTKVVR